jgi:hypothetical protein
MATNKMEVSVVVNVNGKQASRQVDDFERKSIASFGRVAKAGAAALGFFYGGIARQAASETARVGDLLGRGTPVGAEASRFWGRVGAANTATDRTVDTFGIAGKSASKEQILAVYNMHRMMEQMRSDSKARVESIVGEKRGQDLLQTVLKDINFTLKNLGPVLQNLGSQFKLR